MKRVVVVAVVTLLIIGGAATQIFAYDPPGQSTDNATDVIIWHGDTSNVTLSGNATVVIDDFEDAINAAVVELADRFYTYVLSIVKLLMEAVIVLLLNIFAFQYRDRWLFLAGGFALMLYGFSIWDDWKYLSILLVITGMYQLSKTGWDKKAWER